LISSKPVLSRRVYHGFAYLDRSRSIP
jgi:hypothetical protein